MLGPEYIFLMKLLASLLENNVPRRAPGPEHCLIIIIQESHDPAAHEIPLANKPQE